MFDAPSTQEEPRGRVRHGPVIFLVASRCSARSSPDTTQPQRLRRRPRTEQPSPASGGHFLRVDPLLRDSFNRLPTGRASLPGGSSPPPSASWSARSWVFSGYAEGTRPALDTLLMRSVDVGLSPYLLPDGHRRGGRRADHLTILLVLGLTSWFGTARIIRSKTIQVRHPTSSHGVPGAGAVHPDHPLAPHLAQRRCRHVIAWPRWPR
jgi:ABC-type dipeptide/oligopeptide/nickel transport system permease subunit